MKYIKNNILKGFLKGPRYKSGKFKDNFGNVFEFPDRQSFAWTYIEVFEKEIYFFKTDKEEPIIIDCGANIGVSVIYFKKVFPNSRIIAFEPDPFLYKYLEKNVINNNLKNVELYMNAVWDKKGEIEFSQEKSDSGRISFDKTMGINESSIIKVRTCLLSEFIDNTVDFLKIDIEGAENNVIAEVEKKLKFVDRIFIESHSFVGKQQDLDELLKILSMNNFRYYITEGAVTSVNPFKTINSFLNMDMQVNIHALKFLN